MRLGVDVARYVAANKALFQAPRDRRLKDVAQQLVLRDMPLQ